MINSVEITTLSRLLTLNNEIHDLQNLLGEMPVPQLMDAEWSIASVGQNAIAEMQEQIDRQVRVSLTLFWLGSPAEGQE